MFISQTAWCGASLHLLFNRKIDHCQTRGMGSISAISSKTPGGKSMHLRFYSKKTKKVKGRNINIWTKCKKKDVAVLHNKKNESNFNQKA